MSAYVTGAGRWTSPPLGVGDETVAAWAARTLATDGFTADGLVLATLDSGARESVQFWRASRETGLAFANPRGFAWTLSNSATGRIAQELGVRGPTYTLVGRTDALAAALEHALAEVATDDVSRVLVAALDGVSDEETRLAAVCVADAPIQGAIASLVARAPSDPAAIVDGETASETLTGAIARLAGGREAAVGSDRDGWLCLTPLARARERHP